MGKTASSTGSTLLGSGGSNTILEGNLPSHQHTFSATTAGQSQSHNHTVTLTDPGHLHTTNHLLQALEFADGVNDSALAFNLNSTETTDSATTGITVSSVGNASQDHTHTVSGNTGTTGSGTVYFQPFIAVNYIIKHD